MEQKVNMKIACIGNMNNMMFCLVRYLRERGYEADLFLVEEFDHFLPQADAYDDEYKKYTKQSDWYWDHWNIKKEKMREDMKGYNFIIANDRVPGYLYKAGLELDLFLPHGGDLIVLPFQSYKFGMPKKTDVGKIYFTRCQRLGIVNAKNTIFDATNDVMEGIIDRLKLKGNRFFLLPPMLYINQYIEGNLKKSKFYEQFKDIRSKYNLVIFQHCRQMWTMDPKAVEYKGNEILIKSFAKFLQSKTSEVNPVLVLFAYGPDLAASEKLVESLNISDRVLWMPLMSRKDLMAGIDMCDLAVGELGNSWLTYGSVVEILTMKKPFIGYREDERYLNHYAKLYPMASANTVDQVEAIFHDYMERPEYYKTMGEKGFEWVKKYLVENSVNKVVELIEKKKKELSVLS